MFYGRRRPRAGLDPHAKGGHRCEYFMTRCAIMPVRLGARAGSVVDRHWRTSCAFRRARDRGGGKHAVTLLQRAFVVVGCGCASWCWAWRRRIRVLMLGCWCWSIQRGGIHSGRPSALMRQVQPFCRKWVWWYLQSRVRLSRSVGPPSIQSRMWCRSHQLGGWVQPGKQHPASRAISAMVWPGEASRWVLPNAKGTLLWLMMVGQISASSAIRSN